MKLSKTQNADALTVDRAHHAKKYQISVNKNMCFGCELCSLICPREAIKMTPTPKKKGEKARKAAIDIDQEKCSFCGICSTICPFGAIQVQWDGKPFITVVEKESFPQLTREIKVDSEKCDPACVKCEEACPLKLVKVTVQTQDGQTVTPEQAKTLKKSEKLKVNVAVKQEQCPTCRICEARCPEGALKVTKSFYGTLKINTEKCPENCRDCLDVCPLPGTLFIADDGKVHVNEAFCVYCGACKLVCPVENALELKRTSIRHTQVKSGAWNKALEKLTSTKEMTKELHTKAVAKSREAVIRRFEEAKKQ